MAKFHINPESGNVGPCKSTKGQCPFGSLDEHFDDPEDAMETLEEYYGSFDRWNIPEKNDKLGQKLYEGFIRGVQYDDISYAQAGQVAKWLANSGSTDYTVSKDSRYDAELTFPGVEGETHEVTVKVSTKRNRVNYTVYAGGKEVWESEIVDVDNGAEMETYLNELQMSVYDAQESGEFDL